jgi:H+/gluconate symporter-like permease
MMRPMVGTLVVSLLTGREWLVYVFLGALVVVPISLALGRGWGRQSLLALVGFALVGALYVFALAVGCSPDARECAPELALVLGGLVLVGWLAGIACTVAARRAWAFRQSRAGSSASHGVR